MDTLLVAGVVCAAAAIVGGGLSWRGFKIPLIGSVKRQVVLGLFGGVLIFLGLPDDEPPICENPPAAAQLRLNEICAVGSECDDGADFVEIYNFSGSSVDLSCYFLKDKGPELFRLSGELPAGEVRGWATPEMFGNLSVARGDEVSLRRARPGGGVLVDDTRPIDDSVAYHQRVPDGGEWETMTNDQAEANGNVGTLNEANRSQ